MKIAYSILLCFLMICCCTYSSASGRKMDYWSTQRKGANFFNKTPSSEWFLAAKDTGIEFTRLAPDKWQCEQRDFLIGDADAFQKIPSKDLQLLTTVLDDAHKNNVKVVVTLLSLPGSRWRQNNENRDDLRIWQDKKYTIQTAQFWKSLALQLKEHPAVVGYNILNEPHPELLEGISDFRKVNFDTWYESVKGSLADLNLFYEKIVQAIREVDQNTPIILETGMYATPWAIQYLKPIGDVNTLYSFHMYEPYAYTTRKINNGRYTYPGELPYLLEGAESNSFLKTSNIYWNKCELNEFFKPVIQWQEKYKIPSSQIFVGEFGCDRTTKGAEKYLADLIEIFNTNNWHWAFYSFREDCWDSMDYELGQKKPSWKYWEAAKNGTSLDEFRTNNPLFEVIKVHLGQSNLLRS